MIRFTRYGNRAGRNFRVTKNSFGARGGRIYVHLPFGGEFAVWWGQI